jgi:hypothetical protein
VPGADQNDRTEADWRIHPEVAAGRPYSLVSSRASTLPGMWTSYCSVGSSVDAVTTTGFDASTAAIPRRDIGAQPDQVGQT